MPQALACFQERLKIAQEVKDRRGEGSALGNLGTAYLEMGAVARAIEYFTQQLAITQSLTDRRSESRALGSLGNAYAQMGAIEQAIDFYERASAIKQEIGDRQEVAMISWNLGLLLEAQGDHARARQLMSVYVSYLRDIGHPLAAAYAVEADPASAAPSTARQSPRAVESKQAGNKQVRSAYTAGSAKDYKAGSKR